MRYLSVCSGIEAASVAWKQFGFEPIGFAEIDKAASSVLAYRFPDIPNYGDFTKIELEKLGQVDILVGGTPCQAFSIAGNRLSLQDARGNLTLAYTVLAHELARSNGLRNAVWENVPGVLNTPDNAFGCFLSAIVGADDPLHTPDGEGWPDVGMVAGPRARAAWRVLDAQYFGLAQRRKRVFVVVDFGNGADPAEVLFERQGLRGNSAPRRKAREGVAGTAAASAGIGFGGNHSGPIDTAACLTTKGVRLDIDSETFIAMPTANYLRAKSNDPHRFDTGNYVAFAIQERAVSENPDAGPQGAGVQEGVAYTLEARHHVQAVCFQANGGNSMPIGINIAPTMVAQKDCGSGMPAVAFDLRGREGGAQFEGPHDTANIRAASGGSSRSYVAAPAFGISADCFDRDGEGANGTAGDRSGLGITEELSPTIRAKRPNAVAHRWAMRRLTPRECERLQGFPDDWTLTPDARGKPQADGPRYKQLGNSMAVNVMAWLGKRLLASMEAA